MYIVLLEFFMLPARTKQHVSDTRALRILMQKIPDTWLIRNVEERDYGIDLTLELFKELPEPPKNEGERADVKVAVPKGQYVLLQVKGRSETFTTGKLSGFPVKTMEYANLFKIPFFVVYVTLDDEQIHFLWLQKYIETNLASQSWKKQEEIALDFPKENLIDINDEKKTGITKLETLVSEFYNEIELFNIFKEFFLIKELTEGFTAGGVKESPFLRDVELFIKKISYHYKSADKNTTRTLQQLINTINQKIIKGWSTQSPQMVAWIQFIDFLKEQEFVDLSEEIDEGQKDDGIFTMEYKSLDDIREICENARMSEKCLTETEINELQETLNRVPQLLLGCAINSAEDCYEYPY